MNEELTELYHKMDSIAETLKRVEIVITKMESDFNNDKERNTEKLDTLKEQIDEAKEARKVIHKRQDDYEIRLKTVEASPVFQEWAVIKKNLNNWLWRAIGLFILLLLLRSIPDIIVLIE